MQLPRDIIIYIFGQYLSQWEWVRVKRVCKRFNTIINGVLWTPLINADIEDIITEDAFMDLKRIPPSLYHGIYEKCSVNMASILFEAFPNSYKFHIFQSCTSSNEPVAMYILSKLSGVELDTCISIGFVEAIQKGLSTVVDKMLEHLDMKDSRIDYALRLIFYYNMHLLFLFLKKNEGFQKVSGYAIINDRPSIIKFLIDNYDKYDANYYLNIACKLSRLRIINMILFDYYDKIDTLMAIKVATEHKDDAIVSLIKAYNITKS